jgi:hypothetical protein
MTSGGIAPGSAGRRDCRQAPGAVPLATPIPAHGVSPPGEHLLALGRLTAIKGYDLAARQCRRLGLPLVMARPVSGESGG